MRRSFVILLIGIFSTLLSGKEVPVDPADRDMDGVADRYDQCPNTPFFALVNKKGCTVRKIKVSKEKENEMKKLLSRKN